MSTFKGILTEDFGNIQVTEKFSKREFVLDEVTEYNGNVYHNPVKMQLVNDKCSLLDPFKPGDEITVTYSLKGNRNEKDGKVSYFVNINAFKLEGTGTAQPASTGYATSAQPSNTGYTAPNTDGFGGERKDDLPFRHNQPRIAS